MSDFHERLEQYLIYANEVADIRQLTPDASTREYFRIGWKGSTAIACVYPEPFIAAEQNYLDVTELFVKAGLPVAGLLDFNEGLGVILIEDLGDRILRDVLIRANPTEKERLTEQAVALIPLIQAATESAFETASIASRLLFDTEKLLWELNFFKEHYFGTLKDRPLESSEDKDLRSEFAELSRELEKRATVLCHRDFHAANLMIDGRDELRIIDYQDARIGSMAYDLVSFLLDRVTEPPSKEWIVSKQEFFLTRREMAGFDPIDPLVFADEFRLQTIQRCLKAVGTFSFQSATRGKTYFLPFIQPMFRIVANAVLELDRFPNLARILKREISLNDE